MSLPIQSSTGLPRRAEAISWHSRRRHGRPVRTNCSLWEGVPRIGVHLGVHNPRKIRSLPVTLGNGKGQRVSNLLISLPFPFRLKVSGAGRLSRVQIPPPAPLFSGTYEKETRTTFGNPVSIWVSTTSTACCRHEMLSSSLISSWSYSTVRSGIEIALSIGESSRA